MERAQITNKDGKKCPCIRGAGMEQAHAMSTQRAGVERTQAMGKESKDTPRAGVEVMRAIKETPLKDPPRKARPCLEQEVDEQKRPKLESWITKTHSRNPLNMRYLCHVQMDPSQVPSHDRLVILY